MRIDWNQYDPGEFYDELISTPGNPRTAARSLAKYLGSLSDQQLNRRQRAAELAIEEMGITFTVYSEGENIDRAWPFDIIPRVISAREWQRLREGLIRCFRLGALGCIGSALSCWLPWFYGCFKPYSTLTPYSAR